MLYTPEKRTGNWREKYGKDKFICLYVGRLSYEKGLGDYLEAIRQLNEKHQDKLVFVFAGDGPYRDTQALAHAILVASSFPELREKIREGALTTARGRSWDSVMERLMQSYDEVLEMQQMELRKKA